MSNDAAVWHDDLGLNDDDKGYLTDKGVKSAGDFIASYRELERYQGNSIALPDDKASAEDWARIHNRLGRPAQADGYDFGDLNQVDDKGKAEIEWFRGAAHELGFSQKQAAALLERYAERGAEQLQTEIQTRTEAHEKAMARLHAEWGAETGRNTALAERAVKALGLSQDEVNGLVSGPGGKAMLSRVMARIAPILGEDHQIGQAGNNGLDISTEDAKAKIAAVYDDPEHPYHKAGRPGHGAAVDSMRKFFQASYSDQIAV